MLRLAFSTAEPSAPGRRAAMLGYRVHIHKERVSRGDLLMLAKLLLMRCLDTFWAHESPRGVRGQRRQCQLCTSLS